ncbi:hypothetical protein LOAG_18258 [Loa loa]|uniref:Uncharacterized protein n=2 Tax=Loa loa TaxID=7209 RepID=A0A1S0UGD4_LOALO|nr:hypothetical protein LOAG_18258 [Loa loa]EJD74428.1 hypothetical protein LOAG_18258 [Loa loa]
MLRWPLLCMLLFPFANCSYLVDSVFSAPVMKKDEIIDKDKYGYFSMKNFGEQRPLKRLRPCFYSPIQCLMKKRTVFVENFMDNYQ